MENDHKSPNSLVEISNWRELSEIELGRLVNDMASYREWGGQVEKSSIRNQRAQEIVERMLNDKLLKISALDEAAYPGNTEVEKRSVFFEGVEIPVYDLKGVPFRMLSTTIDYKRPNPLGRLGTETFRMVMDNPAIWAERRDEAEKTSGFGTEGANARGDTISTSFRNSERNMDSHVPGELVYGFETVGADSIISIFSGDGATSNMAGQQETTLSSMGYIDMLEGPHAGPMYNEVLLRRYNEDGAPKEPDYIIVEDGKISEASLRHAKYFNIPIVNIERSIYEEKAGREGESIIDSISADDSYQELNEKIEHLSSMSKFKGVIFPLEEVGRGWDISALDPDYHTPLELKGFEASKIEQRKRLDFIKETLEEATREVELATERGLRASETSSQFDSFRVHLKDVRSQTTSSTLGVTKDQHPSTPGSCNCIWVSFRLKGSSRQVITNVYDGQRPLGGEEALARAYKKYIDIDKSDSSYYDALEPAVRKYLDAFHKNQELYFLNLASEQQ